MMIMVRGWILGRGSIASGRVRDVIIGSSLGWGLWVLVLGVDGFMMMDLGRA